MAPRLTRISLPDGVDSRWSDRLDWYSEDFKSYDLNQTQIEAAQTLNKIRPKRLKTRCVYQIPYHGKDHPLTKMVDHVLDLAIFDAWELRGEITSSQETKLQKMRKRWVECGEFKMPPATPRAKLPDEVVAHRDRVEALVHEYVEIATKLLLKKASPVIVQPGFKDKLVVKTSWAPGRRFSRGGYYGSPKRPKVSFALRGRFDYDPVREKSAPKEFFHEYASIKASADIGSCAGSLEVMVATIVAHEMAHAAQHTALYSYLAVANTVTERQLEKTHGHGWQEIYRYLRTNWVNKMPSYESLFGRS